MTAVPCPHCGINIWLDWEAEAPEPETGYAGGLWLIAPPQRCPSCRTLLEVADLKRRLESVLSDHSDGYAEESAMLRAEERGGR